MWSTFDNAMEPKDKQMQGMVELEYRKTGVTKYCRLYWKCIHFQWSGVSHAPHFTEKNMKIYINPIISNDSGPAHALHSTTEIMKHVWKRLYFQWFSARPCCALHQRIHETCMEFIYFQWFCGVPRSPVHENNQEKYTHTFLNIRELPTLHATKEIMKNNRNPMFSMILGPHAFSTPTKKSWQIIWNVCIFNDSGASHAPRSTKEIMNMYRNSWVFNDSGASHAFCGAEKY